MSSDAGKPTVEGGMGGADADGVGGAGEGGDGTSRAGTGTGGSATSGGGGSAGHGTAPPCEGVVTRSCLDVLPVTSLGAGGESGGSGLGPAADPESLFPHPSAIAFTNSALNGVNSSGQMAGVKYCSNGQRRAVLFEDGVPRELTEALGAEHSEATAINDNGVVIGKFAYRYLQPGTPDKSFGFIWKDGVVTSLEELGDVSMVAINNQDQVLIMQFVEPGHSDPDCGRSFFCSVRGLLWQSGTVTDLGTLGGAWTTPIAMNNHGVVIGRSQRAGSQSPRDVSYPFIWQSGTMTALLEPSISSNSQVVGGDMWINDAGQVFFRGRLWAGDQPITPSPAGDTLAQAVNEDGTFAGVSWVWLLYDQTTRPIVFKGGQVVPLWGVVQGKELLAGEVRDMNESGLIVGTASTVELRWTQERLPEPYYFPITTQAVLWSPDCYLGCCSRELGAGGAGGAGAN